MELAGPCRAEQFRRRGFAPLSGWVPRGLAIEPAIDDLAEEVRQPGACPQVVTPDCLRAAPAERIVPIPSMSISRDPLGGSPRRNVSPSLDTLDGPYDDSILMALFTPGGSAEARASSCPLGIAGSEAGYRKTEDDIFDERTPVAFIFGTVASGSSVGQAPRFRRSISPKQSSIQPLPPPWMASADPEMDKKLPQQPEEHLVVVVGLGLCRPSHPRWGREGRRRKETSISVWHCCAA
jgi:hypothetical protein